MSSPRFCTLSATADSEKKELSLSFFPSRAGGLLTAGRQKTPDQRSGGSETGECVLQTPASGMLASVRLSAHSQLEPHCCLAHSAGRECQLPPSHWSTATLLEIYKDGLPYHHKLAALILQYYKSSTEVAVNSLGSLMSTKTQCYRHCWIALSLVPLGLLESFYGVYF